MTLFEINSDKLRKIEETSFAKAGIKERDDLQRLLRKQIEVISPDTLIIAEEFGEWQDSKRRIDLLGIDKDANLVVIELKRTEDGGHMELQAIRYAAMVSTMTFERAIKVYEGYLRKISSDLDAHSSLLEFLEWENGDEDTFAQDVRIVLASAEFSKELTTAVMWLNERDIDIQCIRMKPYLDNDRLILDVQQIVPLPEAEEYQVQIKEKQQRERQARKFNLDLTKYDVTVNGTTHKRLSKRLAIFTIVRQLCDSGHSPEQIAATVPWYSNRMFGVVEGALSPDEFVESAKKKAEAEGKRFAPHRFYCSDEELILFDDKTYALSNQWGKRTQKAIELLLKAFSDVDIQCRASI